MRRGVFALAALAVAAPAAADPIDPVGVVTKFKDALLSDSIDEIAAHLQPPVRYAGLSFDDDHCTATFGARGVVTAAHVTEFAVCLPTLEGTDDMVWLADVDDPHETRRRHSDRINELYAWVGRKGRHQIVRLEVTYAADPGDVPEDEDPGLHPRPKGIVPPRVLEALRTGGQREVAPDDATRAAIAKAGAGQVVSLWKVCVDATGKVTRARALAPSDYPAWEAAIAQLVRAWRFRPYAEGDQPIAVCTAFTFTYTRP